MFKLGRDTGSMTNHFYGNAKQIEPKVGLGATILMWSDRHAATIVKVTPCQVHVQQDIATRIDKNGMSESQQYTYVPNPNAPVLVFRKTKRGWHSKHGGLAIGIREEYYDYSF